MDFSRLPDNVFLKILEYLPLEECIRSGRVNKSFRRIAQLATSRTKSLDLFRENRFGKLTADQLAVILDLCSSNLEYIVIGGDYKYLVKWQQLATIFSNYECPRLTQINLSNTPIDQAIFEQLIRNCPNMECLVWYKFTGFPAITNNSLKFLCLAISDDAILQTLIGHCPNLEEIVLHTTNGITAGVLDQFFGSTPHVHWITIHNHGLMNAFAFNESELVSFCNLPLTTLKIEYCRDGDSLLSMVARSFPHLQQLSLRQLQPTNAGIASLAALQELQFLHLHLFKNGEPYDQGIRQLAYCKNLRHLQVYRSNMTGDTLVNLLRSCSHLERVEVLDITEVDSPEEAVVILECLAGIPQRDINIQCNLQVYLEGSGRVGSIKSIWKAEPVKAAIKKLEEEDGLKIKIENDCWIEDQD